jgi:biofilm PGA synthesis lipoprotein PgaB
VGRCFLLSFFLGSVLSYGVQCTSRSGLDWTERESPESHFELAAGPSPAKQPFKGIKVLMYHNVTKTPVQSSDVSEANFVQQMDFLLQKGYKTLTIDEYISQVSKPTAAAPKQVLLTFDDGYLSNAEFVKEQLTARKMKAVFFVVTGFQGHGGQGTASGLPHMTWEQAKQLHQSELFDVHNHSRFHSSLLKDFGDRTSGRDGEEWKKEMDEAQASLELELGSKPRVMAFPFGDYDKKVLDHISKQGFKAAFSVDERGDFGHPGILSIPRIGVGKDVTNLKDFQNRGLF